MIVFLHGLIAIGLTIIICRSILNAIRLKPDHFPFGLMARGFKNDHVLICLVAIGIKRDHVQFWLNSYMVRKTVFLLF